MMKSFGKKKDLLYYSAYSICFLILSFLCFCWYLFSDHSFIFQPDGWQQHFRALLYYSDYLRNIIRNLWTKHQLIIPDWNFYIGEGSDIINALHYYVIGDPIALLSVFVPSQYMHYFYSFSSILRLYLAGIAFSVFAFGTGKKNDYAVLAGALTYSFCTWTIVNVARHPYFLNPMIYFPLLLLGVEKIIHNQRPYLFVFTVAVSAASNFYFFYMIVILTAIYVLVRVGLLNHKDWRKGLMVIGKITLMSIVGVCIAGILFVPVLFVFLQDARFSVEQPFHLFYPLTYYSSLPSVAISNAFPYWLCMGFSAPVIIAYFHLSLTKRSGKLFKTLFLICIVIIVFPIAGRLLNGMSYMSNRWSWAFSLLSAYVLVDQWDALFSLKEAEWRKIFLCCIAYYALCLLLDESRSSASMLAAIPLFFVTLVIMKDNLIVHKQAIRQALLILVIGINAINLAFGCHAPTAGNYISETIENKQIQQELENNEAVFIKKIAYEDVYPRYSGRSITRNANLSNQISSTQYYWSLSNPAMNQFRMNMEMREGLHFAYNGYDDRTTLLALSSVQYYSTKASDKRGLPYGYKAIDTYNAKELLQEQALNALKLELGTDELTSAQRSAIANNTKNDVTIYKNQYALPLGYCYDAFITQKTWESLDPIQKQEVQLEAVYLEAPSVSLAEYCKEIPDYRVPYTIECQSTEVSKNENCFITTADKTKVVLSFTGTENAEVYLRIAGLEFERTPEFDLYSNDAAVDPLHLYNKTNWNLLDHQTQLSMRKSKLFWNEINDAEIFFTSSEKVTKGITYRRADSTFSSGRQDFVINMGYTEKPVTSITVTLPYRGRYSFQNLEVYSVPMEKYPEKVQALQANTLQKIQIETDAVSGTINLDSPKFLCMAIPYAKGWTAFIDGNETPVLPANERYLGIVVPSGLHHIQFNYGMPYKHAGTVVSLVGIFALAIVVLFTEKNRSRRDAVNQ